MDIINSQIVQNITLALKNHAVLLFFQMPGPTVRQLRGSLQKALCSGPLSGVTEK